MASTENRKHALEMAIRRNRGHLIRAAWLASLQQACRCDVSEDELLPIEGTERLKQVFFSKVRDIEASTAVGLCVHRYFAMDRIEAIHDALRNLCIDVRDMEVVLFSSVDRYIGAIRVPADRILVNVRSVWEVVGDDLCIATVDIFHGLCLGITYYDESGRYTASGLYELTAWGKLSPVPA